MVSTFAPLVWSVMTTFVHETGSDAISADCSVKSEAQTGHCRSTFCPDCEMLKTGHGLIVMELLVYNAGNSFAFASDTARTAG